MQLAPSPGPAYAPQAVYPNRQAPAQPVQIVQQSKKRVGFGCGTLILVPLIGCCLWGVFFRSEEFKPAQPAPPAPAPLQNPTLSNPLPSAGPFQPPPIQERQQYDARIVAKVDALVAGGMIQVYFPQGTIYFNPQFWRALTPQEKKAQWETFREYFRIKTGSRDVRILSSFDGEDLSQDAQ